MRRAFGLALLATVVLISPRSIALADIPTPQVAGTFTTTGPQQVLPLTGQSTCSIVIGGTGTGMTIVPQASSDNGATWVTVSTIGGGAIVANGTYVGAVAGTGLTNFRFNVSAISGGSATYYEACSAAGTGSTTVSGSVTANQGSPNSPANAWPINIFNGANEAAVNAAGQLSVTAAPPVTAAGSFVLTSASPTTCTSLETGVHNFFTVFSGANIAQTVTVTFYDEGATPTCAAADTVYSALLGASQVVNFVPGHILRSGLAYTISGPLLAGGNIYVDGN